MLHDERTRIQHQNSSPDATMTEFYIENAVKFMMRFLAQDLGLDLGEEAHCHQLSEVRDIHGCEC